MIDHNYCDAGKDTGMLAKKLLESSIPNHERWKN